MDIGTTPPNTGRTEVTEATVTANAMELMAEVEKTILGKSETVEKALIALLCNGHLLIEDIPGVGKTTLAKALARTIGGVFRRIQFTPDLLPADVTGSSIFNQKTSEFEFRQGPIFANIVLADEINRATPKTQAALLEAMEERQVTADGVTHNLPRPFFVIATQNNIEMTGTYPLPEAQLDRFFARLELGYPSKQDEAAILDSQRTSHPLESVRTVVSSENLIAMQGWIRNIHVHPVIREYIVEITRATRDHPNVHLGASPRGSLALMAASQAKAALNGRDFVTPDDVKSLAPSILAHRLIPRAESRLRNASGQEVVQSILNTVPVPVRVG